VKASPQDQALLLELQALDTKLQQLAHRASSLPELAAVRALTVERDTLRRSQAEQRGRVEDVRLELSRLESDVAVVDARIARDTDRIQTSSSPKDVAALEQELESLRKRKDDLEEIELSVMERLDEAEAALAAPTGALEELAVALADVEKTRDEALEVIADEDQLARASRDAIARRVPADLLALYERQRARYGFGASLLRFGVSSATGVTLLADELARIRAAAPDDVLMCPSSDAILVRTSESGL
jgi:predicted  nucleic acid-binding Zn-ribbon protein